MAHTAYDCLLDGQPIPLDRLALLTSDEIARVVGKQEPGSTLTDAQDYTWCYQKLALPHLRECAFEGEEPEGGWKALYVRHQNSDKQAVMAGSLEYAGRQEWCEKWAATSALYPLFIV